MKNIKFKALLFSIIILSSPEFISAQTFNLQNIPSEKTQFGLRFDKAFYSDEYNYSTLSGVYELNLDIPLSRKLNLIASVPYIHTSFQADYFVESGGYEEGGLGNIFIGLQTKPESPEDSRSTISFGVFLPTADKEAAFSGFFVNYYYLQKYLPNSLGFYFNYAYHKMPKKGFHYGVEGGPNIKIPTKKGLNTELFLHYGGSAGYQIDNFLVNAELLWVFIASGEAAEFSDRFVHLIDFGFQLNGDVISPKIFYEIYLKDGINDYIDGILGIGINVSVD